MSKGKQSSMLWTEELRFFLTHEEVEASPRNVSNLSSDTIVSINFCLIIPSWSGLEFNALFGIEDHTMGQPAPGEVKRGQKYWIYG